MSLNLNGFGYDIANGCNAMEKRIFLQYMTGLYITIVPVSLPYKIGNLVQRFAPAHKLVLANIIQSDWAARYCRFAFIG